MKNLRSIVLATLVGTMTFLGLAQPVSALKLFVEQSVAIPVDTTPEPELDEVLPLIYSNIKFETETDDSDSEAVELFAPLFVDNSKGVISKTMSVDKEMPIEASALKGISTFFSRFHPGIDYRANLGTPIRAVLPGTVNEISFDRGGYGRYLVLVHHTEGKTLFSLYAHLSDTKVTLGDTVKAGEVIGAVGLTGHTTGPHLHFELHDTHTAINPNTFFAKNNLAILVKK